MNYKPPCTHPNVQCVYRTLGSNGIKLFQYRNAENEEGKGVVVARMKESRKKK